MYQRIPRAFGAALGLAALLTFTGCGDDDSKPTGPSGSDDVNDVEATAAVEFVTPFAVGLVEQAAMVASLELEGLGSPPDLGGFARTGSEDLARAAEPSWSLEWDAANQEYVGTFAYDDPPAFVFDLVHRVQYRDAQGQPQGFAQHSADKTDGARYRATAALAIDLGAASEGEATGTMVASYEADTTIAGLLSGSYTAVGTGTYDVDVDVTATSEGQTQSLQMDVSMSYELDIAVSAGGCPTGTSTIVFAPYRLDVTYDGTATATWTLSRTTNGEVLLNGAETLSCGEIAIAR